MARLWNILHLVGIVTVLGLANGCSEEQAPKPSEPKRVVLKIERPTPKEQEPTPQVLQPPQQPAPTKPTGQIEREIKKPPHAETVKEAGDQEQEVLRIGAARPSIEKEAEEELKVAPHQVSRVGPKEKEGEERPPEQAGRELLPSMGIYVAQQGETLFSISGSEEVYSHPLKWPLLLWSNLAILDVMAGKGALEHKELPVGTKLRFFTREERKDNLKTLGNKRWVVNIVSDKNTKGMSRLVVKLAKARIPAYITMSKINGEIWFRLRCGFFESPFEAKEMKKRIEEVAGLRDLWLSKVSQQEFEAYGGLIGQRSY